MAIKQGIFFKNGQYIGQHEEQEEEQEETN